MEKLRELLNEFDPYIQKDWEHRDNLWYGVICWESAIFTKEIWIQKIISKEYLFIRWLVERHKINFEKTWYTKIQWVETRNGDLTTFTKYESLLMLLSIKSEPIEFLLSILK